MNGFFLFTWGASSLDKKLSLLSIYSIAILFTLITQFNLSQEFVDRTSF